MKLRSKHTGAREHWPSLFFGPLADVPGFRDFYARVQRASASPMMALMLWKALSNIDVRPILNAVRVPTLILGRQGDLVAPLDAAKELADGIPGAQFRGLPPGPHGLFDDAMAEAILDFVCGEHCAVNILLEPTNACSPHGLLHRHRQFNRTAQCSWGCALEP
jgi:pimeloyl-ACP methyl ester carboxylesterase